MEPRLIRKCEFRDTVSSVLMTLKKKIPKKFEFENPLRKCGKCRDAREDLVIACTWLKYLVMQKAQHLIERWVRMINVLLVQKTLHQVLCDWH